MKQVDFRDLAALQAEMNNETFGPWGPEIRVTQRRINMFADATEDHQWIHVDVKRAKRESPFKGTIAHGFLLVSLLPALMPSPCFELTGYKRVINYGGEYKFMRPVRAESVIHARMRLANAEIMLGDKRTILTYAVEVAVVSSEKLALAARLRVIYT